MSNQTDPNAIPDYLKDPSIWNVPEKYPWPKPTNTVTTSSSSSGNLGIDVQFVQSAVASHAASLSEMKIGEYVVRHTAPPPNAWFRFWQRVLLGVTWRDLRPENDLATLRKLK